MLEAKIEIPRIGGQEFPKIVALGKRRRLSGAFGVVMAGLVASGHDVRPMCFAGDGFVFSVGC